MSRPQEPVFPADTSPAERVRWSNTVANLKLLAEASDGTLKHLLGHATYERIAPATSIIDAHERAQSVYFLIEGVVRVFQRTAENLRYTPKLLRAPTHFGELASLAGHERYRSSIDSIVPCVVARVPLGVLHRCLDEDHALCKAWLKSVAHQQTVTIDFVRQSLFGSLSSQMANVLLSYGDALGVRTADKIAVDYRLSYSDLANQVACTRRSAINVMKDLMRRGLVTKDGDHWLLDRRRLLEELLPNRLSLSHSLDDVE